MSQVTALFDLMYSDRQDDMRAKTVHRIGRVGYKAAREAEETFEALLRLHLKEGKG